MLETVDFVAWGSVEMTALVLVFSVEITVLALAVSMQPQILIPRSVVLPFSWTPAGSVPFAFLDSRFASCLILQGAIRPLGCVLNLCFHRFYIFVVIFSSSTSSLLQPCLWIMDFMDVFPHIWYFNSLCFITAAVCACVCVCVHWYVNDS